jgi:hypothetical protein
MSLRPVIATGQQIGAGWSPALSVAKALAALAEARRTGAEAVYWLADEDHDRAEVASVVGWSGHRLARQRWALPPAGCPGHLPTRPRPPRCGAHCPIRSSLPCGAMSWPWASPSGDGASVPSPRQILRCGIPSRQPWSAGGAWTLGPRSCDRRTPWRRSMHHSPWTPGPRRPGSRSIRGRVAGSGWSLAQPFPRDAGSAPGQPSAP